MGYKVKRIMMWQNGVEKQVYPATWNPGSNTILYVPMENDLLDHSSNHFTLTNSGVTLAQNQANIPVGYFNGSSYLSGPNSNLFSFGDIHLGAWIKINQFNNAQFILSGISSGNIFLGFEYSSRSKRIGIGRNGVAWDSYFGITLSTNTWYYFSFDRQGSSLNIYINNTSLGTATNNISYNTSGGYQIGNDGTGNFVNGYISNLILESKARTAQEILNYYNNTKSNYGG